MSGRDDGCPSCGSSGPAAPPDRAVPGRAVVGTVVSVGLPRSEPVVGRRVLRWARVAAAVTGVLALVTLPVDGMSALARDFAVAAFALPALLVLGVVLHRVTPRPPAVEWDLERVSPARAVLRRLALPLSGAVRGREVDVLEVAVKQVSGAVVDCGIRGAVRPAMPVKGAAVEVYGRRDRSGRVVVRHFVDRTTGAVATVGSPLAATTTRIAMWCAAGVWTAAGAVLVLLLVLGR
ncbi:hypothetical protein [Actinosynnema sp. NPDC020468]|uniref:hypothetical protein n=1 Tax=Actinosynnema sp. NPDC020468 TaxID=3154488 RepID=UPI0033E98209